MPASMVYATTTTFIDTIAANSAFVNQSSLPVKYDGLNASYTLDSTTTPPISGGACFEQLLTAGAATIDLTNLAGTNGVTVSLNAKKPVAGKIVAKSSNTHTITVKQGASNGHPLLGASFSIDIPPGGEHPFYLASGGTTVDATHKTLDVTGTGTEGVDIVIVAG